MEQSLCGGWLYGGRVHGLVDPDDIVKVGVGRSNWISKHLLLLWPVLLAEGGTDGVKMLSIHS